MKPIEMLRLTWFVGCVTGAVFGMLAGTRFPVAPVAPAVLLGLTLLVHAADEKYPGVRWPAVIARFFREHEWNLGYQIALAAVTLTGLDDISGQRPGGVFLLMLVVYGIVTLASPRPKPVPVKE